MRLTDAAAEAVGILGSTIPTPKFIILISSKCAISFSLPNIIMLSVLTVLVCYALSKYISSNFHECSNHFCPSTLLMVSPVYQHLQKALFDSKKDVVLPNDQQLIIRYVQL